MITDFIFRTEGTHPGSPSHVGQCWSADSWKNSCHGCSSGLLPARHSAPPSLGLQGAALQPCLLPTTSPAWPHVSCIATYNCQTPSQLWGEAGTQGTLDTQPNAELTSPWGSRSTRQWTVLGKPWQQTWSVQSPHTAYSWLSCRGWASRHSQSTTECTQATGYLAT